MRGRAHRHLARIFAVALLASLPLLASAELPDPGAFALVSQRTLEPAFLDAIPRCATRGPGTEAVSPIRRSAEPSDPIALARAVGANGVNEGRADLQTAARSATEARERACLWLESARLALQAGFGPEARADLGRAERALGPGKRTEDVDVALRFYRAEALVAMGRMDEARTAYRGLAGSASPAVSISAKLRLVQADVLAPGLDTERAKGFWVGLRDLLEEANGENLDTLSWSPLAGEVAASAGFFAAAHEWLARAEGLTRATNLASIRKAAVLVELDRRDDARRTLTRVVETSRDATARDLARVRLAQHRLVVAGHSERIELLRLGTASRHEGVSTLARLELARELLLSDQLDEAVTQIVALTGRAPASIGAGRASAILDDVIASAVDGATCPQVIERLGASRNLLIQLSREPSPFLAIADCYWKLGFAGRAVEVYRGLVRRFGPDEIPHLSWRLARASIDTGELASARALVRASLRGINPAAPVADEHDARWLWLDALLASREGRDADAAERLERLAFSPALPAELRTDAEHALARTGARVLPADRVRAALEASLGQPAEPDGELRAFVRLRLADLQLEAGDRDAAVRSYRRLANELETGWSAARAAYRRALLEPGVDEMRDALRSSVDASNATPWSRLSAYELRMIALRESIGRPPEPAL